jgi:hypothetical protein
MKKTLKTLFASSAAIAVLAFAVGCSGEEIVTADTTGNAGAAPPKTTVDERSGNKMSEADKPSAE